MRFAIIIVTYTSPKQTQRLVNSLNNGQFDFYIHLDKKVDIETHRELVNTPNVYFVNDRVDIKWAGYTLVEAILNCIRYIKATGKKYDFLNLISGQDYPIKSADYIAGYLSQNIGKEFILYKDFDDEWRSRYERYHLTDYTFKGKYAVEKLINIFAPKRKFPLKTRMVGREVFWTLSQECAEYLVNFIDSRPSLSKFMKLTWGPDEFIFQTILLDSPYKDRVVNDHLRHIIFPPGESHPIVFTTKDFDELVSAKGLFARKFNINTDENILNLLDRANGYTH